MVLKVTRNGTDWIDAPEGAGAAGPCWGFDTATNCMVFRLPDGSGWVNAAGEPVFNQGSAQFYTAKDSALVAVL